MGLSNGKIIIKIDKKYFRPLEVDNLLGDYKKAKKQLKWNSKISFSSLVKEITESEINIIKKDNG